MYKVGVMSDERTEYEKLADGSRETDSKGAYGRCSDAQVSRCTVAAST